tara:strand:+ start:369 stop:518 length:150 start_codon:yes stop_codon:yes gene_type:complete
MLETLQGYQSAAQSNLDNILAEQIIDDRAVIATQGMIDDITALIEGLLV